jgi:hypothetical protein
VPFVAAVQDTWSGFCHGKTNADWFDKGFGAETLRKWVKDRNRKDQPVAWDLMVVAWDYSTTARGGYPGYDDAAKNMPLPAGRNRLAAKEILRVAQVGRLPVLEPAVHPRAVFLPTQQRTSKLISVQQRPANR